MRKIILASLMGLLLVLTGCESSKEDVKTKKFVVIAQNVSSTACSFWAMGTIERTYGLVNVIYHEESDPTTTCSDYNRFKYYDCYTTKLEAGDKGHGSSACALGADSLAGGQNKTATQKKKYFLLVHHYDADYCGKFVIDKIAEDNGYKDITFYADADASCNDFPDAVDCHDKYTQTHEVEGRVMTGASICVAGTDTPPEAQGWW